MVIQQSLLALTHHTHCRQLHKICMSSFSRNTTVSSFQSWLVIPWVARPHLHTSSKWQQCQPNHSCQNRYITNRFTSKDKCHAHGMSEFILALGHDKQGILKCCNLCHTCWPCSYTDMSGVGIVSASNLQSFACASAFEPNDYVSNQKSPVLTCNKMVEVAGPCWDAGAPNPACSEPCRFGSWTLTLERSPPTRMLQVM